MVLFFTCTLGVSVLAMIALLAVKRYELATGKMVFSGVRPGMNVFFETASRWGQKILPALARQYIERVVRLMLTRLQLALAHGVVAFEHTLERVLSAVRRRTEGEHPHHEPSAFLREVADHKKNLLYKKGLKKSPPHDTLQG